MLYNNIYLILSVLIFSRSYAIDDIYEDSRLTTPQLITKYSYGSEIHHVKTEDNYILELHRVTSSPNVKRNMTESSKKVVLLMHGLPSTSADYILAGPNVSLGYFLSDFGYDVWMGNTRGNRYSKNHTKISTKDSEFWKFTFHEIGVYDLPATIDYILNQTKREQLGYIGFSQTTTSFFVMCSERPNYMKKISHMQAFAPVVFVKNSRSILFRLMGALGREEVRGIGNTPYESLPNSELIRQAGELFCNDKIQTKYLCSMFLFAFAGYDPKQLNETIVPVIIGHIPAGASNWNMAHYGQMVVTGHFSQFDLGEKENMVKYRSKLPPEYNLKNITVPIALHYSKNDIVSHPDEILKLVNLLPNVIGLFQPPIKEFNHLDYLFAIDVRSALYNKVLEILDNFS